MASKLATRGWLVLSMLGLVVVLAIVVAEAVVPPGEEYRKKLQGPPSEFENHRVPPPSQATLVSESSWHELVMTRTPDGESFEWSGEVKVDSEVELDISLFSPFEDHLDLIVKPPGQLPLSVNSALRLQDLWAERAAAGIGIEYDPPFTKVHTFLPPSPLQHALPPCLMLTPVVEVVVEDE